MIESEDLEWRMYGIVPYNISDIQKGIQFGHAVQEYNNLMFETISNIISKVKLNYRMETQ